MHYIFCKSYYYTIFEYDCYRGYYYNEYHCFREVKYNMKNRFWRKSGSYSEMLLQQVTVIMRFEGKWRGGGRWAEHYPIFCNCCVRSSLRSLWLVSWVFDTSHQHQHSCRVTLLTKNLTNEKNLINVFAFARVWTWKKQKRWLLSNSWRHNSSWGSICAKHNLEFKMKLEYWELRINGIYLSAINPKMLTFCKLIPW